MKNLILSLLVLSCSQYTDGMLRRIASNLSKKNLIHRISKINGLIQKRLHSNCKNPCNKFTQSKLVHQAHNFGEKIGYYKARENGIKDVVEKFNCNFDIKRKGRFVSALFVRKDKGAIAMYFSSKDTKSCIDIDERLYNVSENNYENEQQYPGFIAGYTIGYKEGKEQVVEDLEAFFYQCKLLGIEFDQKEK